MKYNPSVVTGYFREHGIPPPEYEARFHPIRKWRWDISWPKFKLAVEVQGGIWIRGGHNRGAQMKKDWEKYNAAAVRGWRILYCEPKDLCTAEFAHTIHATMFFNDNAC